MNNYMKIDDLKPIAEKLNNSTDELMVSIKIIRDKINSLNLGIAAFVKVTEEYSIGYGRIGGTWDFIIKTEEKTFSYFSCPRYMRIDSVPKLPELLEALEKVANNTIKRLQEKTVLAQSFVDAINKTEIE